MEWIGKAVNLAEYDKFNMYFLEEVKKTGNDVIPSPIEEPEEEAEKKIIFTSGNTYEYNANTKAIYLVKSTGEIIDKKITIANNIDNCIFETYNQEEKTIIKVTMEIAEKEKITEYVLGYGNKYMSYQDEADYIEGLPVTGIALNKSSTELIYLYDEVTEQLTATITPINASNQNIKWSSSDPNIATISSEGLITTKNEGITTITVTTEDRKLHINLYSNSKFLSKIMARNNNSKWSNRNNR